MQSELRFAQAKITSFSMYAVISRLKSYKFLVSEESPELSCTLTEYPGISLTVPTRSLPTTEDFAFTLKVRNHKALIMFHIEKAGKTGQEETQIKSPILLNLRTNVRFPEWWLWQKVGQLFYSPLVMGGPTYIISCLSSSINTTRKQGNKPQQFIEARLSEFSPWLHLKYRANQILVTFDRWQLSAMSDCKCTFPKRKLQNS